MIYKICIIIACAFAFCNAADYPDEKSDDDPIFDFCVRNIDPDNGFRYTLVSLKHQSIAADSIWKIPKIVKCACNAWSTNVRVATPGVSSGGVDFETCSVVGNASSTSMTKSIPSIKMPTAIRYFSAETSSVSIRDFFKKEVKGIWKASLYCGGGNEKIEFSYEFKARIVGECDEKIK